MMFYLLQYQPFVLAKAFYIFIVVECVITNFNKLILLLIKYIHQCHIVYQQQKFNEEFNYYKYVANTTPPTLPTALQIIQFETR